MEPGPARRGGVVGQVHPEKALDPALGLLVVLTRAGYSTCEYNVYILSMLLRVQYILVYRTKGIYMYVYTHQCYSQASSGLRTLALGTY